MNITDFFCSSFFLFCVFFSLLRYILVRCGGSRFNIKASNIRGIILA